MGFARRQPPGGRYGQRQVTRQQPTTKGHATRSHPHPSPSQTGSRAASSPPRAGRNFFGAGSACLIVVRYVEDMVPPSRFPCGTVNTRQHVHLPIPPSHRFINDLASPSGADCGDVVKRSIEVGTARHIHPTDPCIADHHLSFLRAFGSNRLVQEHLQRFDAAAITINAMLVVGYPRSQFSSLS
jgi:hypothetical protein